MKFHKPDKTDALLCVFIMVFIWFFLFYSGYLIGLVRDEGFYGHAAKTLASWFDLLFSSWTHGDFFHPFSSATIDKYFSYNHEHPTVMKMAYGFSVWLFQQKLHWLSFIPALRLVSSIIGALTAGMLYLFGRVVFNRETAVATPLLFFTMPHIFFHAHLACFDMPVLFFWSTVTLLYLWHYHTRSWKSAVITAVMMGIALGVKHNLFFLPPLLLIAHLIGYTASYRSLPKHHRGAKGFIRALPPVFYLFVVVTLPVYYLVWPWLWYDPWHRFVAYLLFHAKHVNYTTYYFGHELTKGPFPFSFPWGMTLFTTPLPQLILFFASTAWLVIHIAKDKQQRSIWLTLFLAGLFPIFLIALPSVPVFGGIKHWFSGYPFLLVPGTFLIIRGTELLFGKRKFSVPLVVVTFALIALIPLNVKFSRHGAAFFNQLIGGVQGAADKEMQRNFWGYDMLDLADAINKNAPKHARLFIASYAEGLNPDAFYFLRNAGIIRHDIIPINSLEHADMALFFYEKQNEPVLFDIFRHFNTVRPLAITTVDGVYYSGIYRRRKQ